MERRHGRRQLRDPLGELARPLRVQPEVGARAQVGGARQAAAPPLERVELLDDAARLALRELHLDGPELGVGERTVRGHLASGQRRLEAGEDPARRRSPLGARAQALDDLLPAGARARAGPRRPGAERSQRGHELVDALERDALEGPLAGAALRGELRGVAGRRARRRRARRASAAR